MSGWRRPGRSIGYGYDGAAGAGDLVEREVEMIWGRFGSLGGLVTFRTPLFGHFEPDGDGKGGRWSCLSGIHFASR